MYKIAPYRQDWFLILLFKPVYASLYFKAKLKYEKNKGNVKKEKIIGI